MAIYLKGWNRPIWHPHKGVFQPKLCNKSDSMVVPAPKNYEIDPPRPSSTWYFPIFCLKLAKLSRNLNFSSILLMMIAYQDDLLMLNTALHCSMCCASYMGRSIFRNLISVVVTMYVFLPSGLIYRSRHLSFFYSL